MASEIIEINDDKNIIHMPDLDYSIDKRGVGWIYYNAIIKYNDKIAQIDGLTGKQDTYGDLLKRTIRTAITMHKKGIKQGDIVSLCSLNHLDTVIPYLASLFIGAVMAAIHTYVNIEEAISLLKQTKPKIIFVMPSVTKIVKEAITKIGLKTEIVVFGDTDRYTPFSDFLQSANEEELFKPTEAKNLLDTAIMFFTSGTTGLPKSVCHNHVAILRVQLALINAGFQFDVSLFSEEPFWSVYCEHLGSRILTGSTLIVHHDSEPTTFWTNFKYPITLLTISPSEAATIRSQIKPDYINTANLCQVITGGSITSITQLETIKELFPGVEVFNIYGQTDLAGCLTLFKPNDPIDMILKSSNPTSTGRPLPGMSYKVVDINTEKVLGPNQLGELRLKPRFQINGYFNADFSRELDAIGWYKTGDIVYYNENRCFFVEQRIKDVIKYRNMHVFPARIERVLLEHAAVSKAVVVGIPNEMEEEHPLAVVVLHVDRKDVSAGEIQKFVDERVQDRNKLRGGVRIVDHLPTTPTEKVNRLKIKELIAMGKI